jgi:UDP-N-acetyl-D-glucosamine dehydrogenase
MQYELRLRERIDSRSAVVGVVGLGYVGLPLALAFEEAGFPVLGFDVDPEKPAALERGESYIRHLDERRVAAALARGRFGATTDFSRLSDCDAILICVPTPLGPRREPDVSHVRRTAEAIAAVAREGQLVVLESTTYPGTTREEIVPRLAARGLRCGESVFVAYSAERQDPGNPKFQIRDIAKVVGGIDDPSGRVATALYAAAVDQVVTVRNAEVAESSKLLENVFRCVNIALVNELKVVFDQLGIDVWEVIAAAKTKPFGFMPFYPGPGLGGHCIPIDPYYLAWRAAENGAAARFIELAGEINGAMPQWVISRAVEALAAQGKAIRGARVLVLGLAYKGDIDDDRESPSFALIEGFAELGAEVSYCDPLIPNARLGRRNRRAMASVACSAEEIGGHDAVIVATPHSAFADQSLYAQASLVVDCRNLVSPGSLRGTLVKA